MEHKEDSVTLKFLKDTLKKGTDFAQEFWEGTKREAAETKISILIIRK